MMQQRYRCKRGNAADQRRQRDEAQIVLIHDAIINRQHEVTASTRPAGWPHGTFSRCTKILMARRKQRRTESGRAFGYEEINGIKENYFTPCKARSEEHTSELQSHVN